MTNNKLIEACLAEIGVSSDEWFDMGVSETYGPYDSVQMGACECGYTCGVEPDSTSGWCEECGTNTVKSLTMLLGIM